MTEPQQPYEPPAWDPQRANQPPAGRPDFGQPPAQPQQPWSQPQQPWPPAQGYQPPAQGYQQPDYAQYGPNAPTPPGRVEPGAPWPQPGPWQPGQLLAPAVGPTAGAGVRLVGYLIDGLLLSIFNGIINGIFPGPVTYVGDMPFQNQSAVASLLTLILSLVYFSYLNGQGQTVGKRIMRTKVVDAATGQPIGTSRAAIRWVVQMLMSIPLMLGWLSVPLSPDTRGFHDRAANDRVIRV